MKKYKSDKGFFAPIVLKDGQTCITDGAMLIIGIDKVPGNQPKKPEGFPTPTAEHVGLKAVLTEEKNAVPATLKHFYCRDVEGNEGLSQYPFWFDDQTDSKNKKIVNKAYNRVIFTDKTNRKTMYNPAALMFALDLLKADYKTCKYATTDTMLFVRDNAGKLIAMLCGMR
jgi:hypothetical protein